MRPNQMTQIAQIGNVPTVPLAIALMAALALVPFQGVQAEGAQVIEEVVVTARKREETLQEVPVVVTVLTEDSINSQRIEGIKDIGTIVPGMVASKTISGTSGVIYLRGVGTGAANPSFDQAVAINLDGVGINSAQLINAGMFDLRQIEVLKGPQALFYGKNSPGGVIAIHTKDPTDEPEVEFSASYETESEEAMIRGILSSPLGDTLGGRLSFGWSEGDALIDVYNSDQFEQGPAGPVQTAFGTPRNSELETMYLMGTLVWDLTDNLSAKFKYAHLEDNQTGTPYDGIQKSLCGTGRVQSIYPVAGIDNCKSDNKVVTPGINPLLNGALKDGRFAGEDTGFFDNENNFAALELNYEMDNRLTFTSVTGMLENDELRFADASFQVASGLAVTNETAFEQFSQELRLTSNYDGAVNFTAGAFYEDKEINRDTDVVAGSNLVGLPIAAFGLFPISSGRQISEQQGLSWSVFGQLNWDITQQVTLAIGGRYSYEEKETGIQAETGATPQIGAPAVPRVDIPLRDDTQDWDNFSPEVTLRYQHSDAVMFFASYRSGFKSGGFDLSYKPVDLITVAFTPGASYNTLYNEETVDGFEVGMKSTLLDGTLRLNVTAYSFAYEDLQLSKFSSDVEGGLSFRVINAAEASLDGLEVETLFVTPVDGLTLSANVAWAKSEYDTYTADCFTGQTIAMGCNINPDPTTGNFTGVDMSGESLPFASDLSANLGVNFETQVSGGWTLGLNLTGSFKDDYNPASEFVPDESRQAGFWWINASASLFSPDDKWQVYVRGVNLSDEFYNVSATGTPFTGSEATIGTADPSGLPDLIAYVTGGRQITAGITYRM